MTELRGTQLNVDWFGLQTDVVELSDWTNGSSSFQKRSDIIHAIIYNRSMEHLVTIVESGWDVNEMLNVPDHEKRLPRSDVSTDIICVIDPRWVHRTALCEAAKQGWTEGVKVLLHAGATYTTSDLEKTPLVLTLENDHCSPDLIQFLLEHGADPNKHHWDRRWYIPLLQAIHKAGDDEKWIDIVQLLLEKGADPNVITNKDVLYYAPGKCPLSIVWGRLFRNCKTNVLLFKLLVKFGADVHYNLPDTLPLLHSMVGGEGQMWNTSHHSYVQELLDVFYSKAGNIYTEKGYGGTALIHAIANCGNSNCVRWLIRHGADTSALSVTLLSDHFVPSSLHYLYTDTALTLLQAGMRVSDIEKKKLLDTKMAISTWGVRENCFDDSQYPDYYDMFYKVKGMWVGLGGQYPRRKSVIPEYLNQQMVDLQEFSDESLNFYSENNHESHPWSGRTKWIYIVDHIHSMLEFLGQQQSLQWYCRRCVRENLVSLQPSVVKTLPVPAILKRYILCHDV